MKKGFIGLLLLVLLMLGGLVSPVSATSPEALTRLASYFPADAPLFATVRTDDGYIAAIDNLLQRIGRAFPDAAMPASVPFLLNVASLDAYGVNFEDGIRPWLGDSFAFGILSLEDLFSGSASPGVLIAIEITDRTAALDFMEAAYPDISVMEKSRIGDFNVFASTWEELVVAVNDEVILLGTSVDDLALHGDFSRLSADDDFEAVLAMLPAPEYNILMYLDMPALQAVNLEMLRELGMESPLFEYGVNATGVALVGFTLLDERSLTMDVVSQINAEAMSAFDFEMFVAPPVDPAFALRVPADAPFVLLGTELGQAWALSLRNLRRMDAVVAESGGWESFLGTVLDSQTRASLRGFSLNAVLGALNLGFAGITGLSLENEVLPMFSGDYALFVRAVEDESLSLIPDVGFVSEVSDAELAFANLALLQEALDAYGTDYTVEILPDGGQVVAAHWLRSLLETDSPNVDIVFGTDGASFAAGTRRAVLDARTSLSVDPAFLAAQAYFLPDSLQVAYVGGQGLVGLIDQLRESGLMTSQASSDLEALRSVLAALESASISVAIEGEDFSLARYVLTLADLPDGDAPTASR